MNQLHLQIVTPERAVFSADVREVTVPGDMGEFGILPLHRPVLSLVRPGTLVAHTIDSGVRLFAVGSGFAEISHDRVAIVVGSCEGADAIDVNVARSQLADLEKRLAAREFVDEQKLAEHVEEAARARARIALIEKATGSKA